MRTLSAIMFTDIEGFTTLMQHDEAHALHLLDQHKQLFLQQTAAFKGKVIKHLGDGTLTIFNSALHAVQCAIALQRSFNEIEGLHVRIGIHMGDIIHENKDVFGDAVNIASRIQANGIAGGIVVSGKVEDELKNHPEIRTVPMQRIVLKNVEQPVQLFAICASGIAKPTEGINTQHQVHQAQASDRNHYIRRWMQQLRKPVPVAVLLFLFAATIYMFTYRDETVADDSDRTIAVMPIENEGNDAYDYFAYLLSAGILTRLTSASGLNVKSLPDYSADKTKSDEVYRYMRNHKIGYVITGSIREGNGKFLVQLLMKDTRSEVILYKKDAEISMVDIKWFIDQFLEELSDRLEVKHGNIEPRLTEKHMPDTVAEQYYVQGKLAQLTRDTVEIKKATEYFSKAITIDPLFAKAYAGLCENFVLLIDNGLIAYDEVAGKARAALDSALLLDSNHAIIQASKAIYLSSIEGRWVEARIALSRAVGLDSNYLDARLWYAVELSAAGSMKEALRHIDFALDKSLLTVRIWELKLMIQIFARQYANAIRFALSADQVLIGKNMFAEQVTECYFRLGNKDSALWYARLIDDTSTAAIWQAVITNDSKRIREMASSEASNPNPDQEHLAFLYTISGEKEKAIIELRIAFAKKQFNFLKFLLVDPRWDPLRNEPGFQELIQRLEL